MPAMGDRQTPDGNGFFQQRWGLTGHGLGAMIKTKENQNHKNVRIRTHIPPKVSTESAANAESGVGIRECATTLGAACRNKAGRFSPVSGSERAGEPAESGWNRKNDGRLAPEWGRAFFDFLNENFYKRSLKIWSK